MGAGALLGVIKDIFSPSEIRLEFHVAKAIEGQERKMSLINILYVCLFIYSNKYTLKRGCPALSVSQVNAADITSAHWTQTSTFTSVHSVILLRLYRSSIFTCIQLQANPAHELSRIVSMLGQTWVSPRCFDCFCYAQGDSSRFFFFFSTSAALLAFRQQLCRNDMFVCVLAGVGLFGHMLWTHSFI